MRFLSSSCKLSSSYCRYFQHQYQLSVILIEYLFKVVWKELVCMGFSAESCV